MRTTEQIIAGLEGERTTARTEAAVARCDQQIAAHRQLAGLYAEGLGYVERGAHDKAAAVGGRMSELARLVDEVPDFAPASAPAATDAGGASSKGKAAGKPSDQAQKPG